ncbi:MAG: hypothetical protein HQ579_05420 [Candidatus Omnitrophica bacterium]|nr:hypothetical protein [Candidatus Omnitrophota bacterium]
MKEINLNVHHIIKIKIRNHKRGILSDLNSPFSYFLSNGTAQPDILVEIGDFKENKNDCTLVDHKYFVRKNYVYFEEDFGFRGWKAELSGIEEDRCVLKIDYKKTNKMTLQGMLYPDQIMYNNFLYPLLERIFLRKGYLFLHAGGVSDGGKGAVFAGRGSSYKTSLIINLVKKGFYSLGDGWVILKGKSIYSFPTSPSFFNYRVLNMTHENPNIFHKINLACRLISTRRKLDFISEKANLESLFVIYRQDRDTIALERIEDKNIVSDVLLVNNLLEFKIEAPCKKPVGNFMKAYEYTYPESVSSLEYEQKMREAILHSLEGVKLYRLIVPNKWREEYAEHVKNAIKGL